MFDKPIMNFPFRLYHTVIEESKVKLEAAL